MTNRHRWLVEWQSAPEQVKPSGNNLCQCHFVHRISKANCPGIGLQVSFNQPQPWQCYWGCNFLERWVAASVPRVRTSANFIIQNNEILSSAIWSCVVVSLIPDVSKHCGIFIVYLLEIHDHEIKALRFSETSGPTYTRLQIPGKLSILQ
jgi:hypothetical protein